VQGYDSSELDLLLSFASTDGADHSISEGGVCLYGGNLDTGKWDFIDRWNSSLYAEQVRSQQKATKAAFAFLGALAIIDSILDTDDSGVYFEYDYYDYPYSHSYYVRTSDPLLNFTFTTLSVIETSKAIEQMNQLQNAEIQSTMLRSSVASASRNVSGFVHFSNVPLYPDYKVVYEDGARRHEFTFSRTDRAEIISPWVDRSQPLLGLGYAYTLNDDRHSFKVSYLSPRHLGFFCGLTLIEGPDLGATFGLNFKVAPYTWLEGGIEVSQDDDTEKVSASALMGALFCVNHVGVSGGAIYNITQDSWAGELGFLLAL